VPFTDIRVSTFSVAREKEEAKEVEEGGAERQTSAGFEIPEMVPLLHKLDMSKITEEKSVEDPYDIQDINKHENVPSSLSLKMT
jgi:hypothetical protein